MFSLYFLPSFTAFPPIFLISYLFFISCSYISFVSFPRSFPHCLIYNLLIFFFLYVFLLLSLSSPLSSFPSHGLSLAFFHFPSFFLSLFSPVPPLIALPLLFPSLLFVFFACSSSSSYCHPLYLSFSCCCVFSFHCLIVSLPLSSQDSHH